MSNILAIECCTNICSVALRTARATYQRFDFEQKPSEIILPFCHSVLNEAQLGLDDLDLLAYTRGPGAFTGVRLGVAVAQGLALAKDLPTLGFSSLEALAYQAYQDRLGDKIIVALDARMGEVYWGDYQAGTLCRQALDKPEMLAYRGDEYIGVGNGWQIYHDALSQATGIEQIFAKRQLSAITLVELAAIHFNQSVKTQPMPIEPIYLRNQVAKKPK